MSLSRIKPEIQQPPIAKAMERIIPKWKEIAQASDEEGAIARDELIQENEELARAFYRTEYARRSIDWDYAVQLIHAVLNEGMFGDAKGFAKRLNAAVEETASQRDVVLVIPLGFATNFGFGPRLPRIAKPISLGQFKLSRPLDSVKVLNRLLATYGGAPVARSNFDHQVIQSHKALSTHPVLTLGAHGSGDAMRLQPSRSVRNLIWLVELFGRVFDADESGAFKTGSVSRHVFIVNKLSGRLDRVPSQAPLNVSIPLGSKLIKAIGRPEFGLFLELLDSAAANGSLVGRLGNAVGFFGKAVAERDPLARFLFLVIAMEAIFSRDKNAQIKITLADYVALLCFQASDRRSIHADLRKIYDVRSGIVHSGVSHIDSALLRKAEALAVRAVYCSLALATSLRDGTGALEQRFFDELLGIKIGISPNPVKLPAWRGYGPSVRSGLDT